MFRITCATMIDILLYVLVLSLQDVVGCDLGTFGERCDRICSVSCAIYPGENARICDKHTGSCLGGCVNGLFGDHCNETCGRNCLDNTCNQLDGRCTKGCEEKCAEIYMGDFCNKESVPDNQCPPGKFGHSCDHACPPHCGVGSGQSVGLCERDTGKCLGGCRPDWSGDHCNLKTEDFCKGFCNVGDTSNQSKDEQVVHITGMLTITMTLITVLVITNVIWAVIVLIMYRSRRRKKPDGYHGSMNSYRQGEKESSVWLKNGFITGTKGRTSDIDDNSRGEMKHSCEGADLSLVDDAGGVLRVK